MNIIFTLCKKLNQTMLKYLEYVPGKDWEDTPNCWLLSGKNLQKECIRHLKSPNSFIKMYVIRTYNAPGKDYENTQKFWLL
jgi:hypothetical protein